MATSGMPWEVDNLKIIEAINKARGRITQAAKLLQVAYITLKKKIDEFPELQDALRNARMEYDDTLLDMAEDAILYTVSNIKGDPNNGMRAAMFSLNSKGKSRNWSNTYIETSNIISQVDYENQKMIIEAQEQKLKELEARLSDNPLCDKPKAE